MDATFESFITMISAPNASNKTSLIRAISFGLGHSSVPIRNGADHARVELTIDGRTIVREAKRTPSGVQTSGETWLDAEREIELLERFAHLLEDNILRVAIRSGEDFAQTLKSPMDLDTLEARRSQQLQEKRELQRKIKELQGTEDQLEARREERNRVVDRIDEITSEIASLRQEFNNEPSSDDGLERRRESRAELVSERNRYQDRIDSLEEAIDRLESERADVESAIEDAKNAAGKHDVAELEAERRSIHEEMDEVVERIELLQSALTANRELLESQHTGALGQDAGLLDDIVVCWTCGQEAEKSAIRNTISSITQLLEADKKRRREYEPRLSKLASDIKDAEEADRRVSKLVGRKETIDQSLADRRESLETLETQLTDVTQRLADLDAEIEERESKLTNELSSIAASVEEKQVKKSTLTSERSRLDDVIESLESDLKRKERLRNRVETLSDEITALTEKIENLEDALREEFNSAMDDLLEVLDYERIERVWLDGEFELVIAREIDGVTNRATLDQLSESEREMIGLVLALAGYIAYDVASAVPILALDALGAFDADRLEGLLGYFAEETEFLIAAVLPELADEMTYPMLNPMIVAD